MKETKRIFMENKSNLKLNEALNIEGLNYIGSDYGLELYEVLTWEAAESLEAENSSTPAGTNWVEQRDLFDQYLSGPDSANHIFMFVIPGTKTVVAASIKEKVNPISMPNYTFQPSDGSNSNFPTGDKGDGYPFGNRILPVYLLPDFHYPGSKGVILDSDGSHVISAYAGYEPSTFWSSPENQVYKIPSTVHFLTSQCFGYPFLVKSIIIPATVEAVRGYAFEEYSGLLEFEKTEEDFLNSTDLATRWNAGFRGKMVWGGALSDEARAEKFQQIENEKIKAQRARDRLQWIRTAPDIDVLRYREDGKGITILGCKKGRVNLNIPPEINGKPVIAIAPFAFYRNETLEKITVPDSVKSIGRGAFADSEVDLTVRYPRTAILYGDVTGTSSTTHMAKR